MSLTTYNKKRNFKKTPEPSGKSAKQSGKLSFVVQRHDASHLHYDFRLEVEGVLKSWAIPKGPSLNPADKRLAVMVEDHPLKYGSFAGEIPEGNYGAGNVQIWDKGTYESEVKTDNPEKEIKKELAAGSLKFVMHGEHLNGSFALVALKNSEKNWLLIKHKDEFAETTTYNIEDYPSVSEASKTASKKTPPAVKSVRSAANEKISNFISPMLATLGDKPFDDKDWVFEIKWDGYRAISELHKKKIALYSRNGLSFMSLYPEIAGALAKLNKEAVIDGEIVALDKEGKPDFQMLQNHGQRAAQLVYYVFDCLSVNGKDLTSLPLLERKEALKKILPVGDNVLRYSDHIERQGIEFFGKVAEKGLEGMMAKRADASYTTGKRTHDWLKIKNQNTQEAVIAGFTAPRNSRQHFGSLVLGVFDKKKLRYVGHTGTGFSDSVLKSVYQKLKPYAREDSPFDEKIPMKEKVTWVNPEVVCNVKYSELTKDGIFRHPVFMGLRIDKSAGEVDSVDKPVSSKVKSAALKVFKSKKSASVKKAKETVTGDDNDAVITHPDKIFFPEEGIAKGDVVEYYKSIADYILPYLKDRPESLKRNPNGIHDKGFFHKDAAANAPKWVEHLPLYSESAGKKIDYIICNNASTLAYMNNLGCIEINPWNSRVKSLDSPDYLILDIDPSDKNSFNEVIDVALVIGEVLKKSGVKGYPKTSGASGIHVYIPLKAQYTYDQTRVFAEGLAHLVVEQLPKTTTIERSLSKRNNRIYVDYLQNKRGQTLSSVYSLRPVVGASVSTPLEWKEVKHGMKPGDFTIHNTLARLKKKGDLFEPVLKEGIDLQKALKKLGF